MITAPLYSQAGKKKSDITLKSEIFEAPVNEGLMHTAYVRQMSNARKDTAFAKTRGEVAGGGRKPFRQKGTGRARQGSKSSPILRGGGVVFGPRGNRNYTKNMPKKQRRAALFSALSVKAKDKEILILDEFKNNEPKTNIFAKMLSALPVQRKVIIVLPESDVITQKSASNLPNIRVILTQYLNIRDILWADTILFLEPSLKKAEEMFL